MNNNSFKTIECCQGFIDNHKPDIVKWPIIVIRADANNDTKKKELVSLLKQHYESFLIEESHWFHKEHSGTCINIRLQTNTLKESYASK